MPNLTDLSTIRDVCARHDFALSKGFGQNFIINPGICPRIAEAAGIGPGWGALEVGPGIGVLTEQLCKRADKVVSIEVDKRLPPILAETMADYDNFKLVLEDVLKVDLRTLLAEEFGDKPVAVCANLPYYITSPILMRLLEEKLPIRNITVMVQKEAAQRLCAAPGTREAGFWPTGAVPLQPFTAVPRQRAAATMASRHGLRSRWSAAARTRCRPRADAVVVCTPNDTHLSYLARGGREGQGRAARKTLWAGVAVPGRRERLLTRMV